MASSAFSKINILISPVIQLIMHALLLYVVDYLLFTLVKNVHQKYNSKAITSFLTIWVLFVHYNTLFNYYMAVHENAGSSRDIPLNELQKQREYCTQCQYPIPMHAYHCRICNQCTLQQDHHCPWISCIGRENRRYFVNFITYVWIYILNILGLIQLLAPQSQNQNDDILLLQILFGLLFIILCAFSIFHWVLIFKGRSSIQLLKPFGTKQRSVTENIERIFGTKRMIKALMPSVRPLNHPFVDQGPLHQQTIPLFEN